MFTIAPAAPADVPAAAEVLAEAFATDEAMLAITGLARPTVERLAALFRPLIRAGALRRGRVDLARRASDGAVLGAALWEPPGSTAHLVHQAVELPSFFRALGLRGMVHAARNQSALASHRPTEPHWYLSMIGVSGQARGLGVGTALLTSRLALIDANGAPSYLESSNEQNRRLYRRNGFEVIALIANIATARPAAMWRAGTPQGQQ